ncbi:MAG: ABC transporter permease [Eubacterium sp.]|nr:ABC transporter permease [Eubacterium sp.]MBR1674334.1 ABC transporter permease [Eubacterium sp.]
MAEKNIKRTKVRYRGRFAQIPIYIGKNFRMFVYQNDWKVIPMAAFIAALVSAVVRNKFFITMEGTAMGALAVTTISLWNGCFNSIQVVCRERAIIKREHRSGMYIFSYVISHMVYQAFLCFLQTVTMLVIFKYTGVKFPKHGVVVDTFIVEFGITVFLITYAADMMSLFISSVVKTNTAAMTVMPLVLMIQLVFSGGLFSLPNNMKGLTKYMISKQGISCIASEGRYNSLPTYSSWRMVKKIANSPDADEELKLTILSLEMQGYDKQINEEARKSNYKKDYKATNENIRVRWQLLGLFAFIFAVFSMIALMFVDKDRR